MIDGVSSHSKLGASSMHRWSQCPGSVREIAKAPPQIASVYAEEGTVAHAYAARCLKRRPKECRETDDIADEMREAVAVYVGYINDLTHGKKHELHIEKRFDLGDVYPGCYGTADAAVWLPGEELLVVPDYKHGAGVPVEAKDNTQLRYYALGALLELGYPAKRVRLAVVQPRCFHPSGPIREWEVDALDLVDFSTDLQQYAKATEAPDAPLIPGDWCQFCPAAGICPALQTKALEAARAEFPPLVVVSGSNAPALYDPLHLALALDSREIVKAWLKGVDEFAYSEAKAGRCPPGYKLVEKRATRKWAAEGDVVEHLQKAGFGDGVIFEPRAVKSPARMEKLVGKGKLDSFIAAESSGLALVPESDGRPAVICQPEDDFSAVSDDYDLTKIPGFLIRKSAA